MKATSVAWGDAGRFGQLPLFGGRAVTAPPPKGATEFQDVVFFGDDRPFLLRLHVLVDDQPPQQAWQGYVRRWLSTSTATATACSTPAKSAAPRRPPPCKA